MELAGTYITQVEFDAIREEHQKRKYANYKNGGITLPQTQFVGPGNRVVDKDNKSNFNQLPDNCLDWTALEHDVDYHNAGNTGSTQLHEIAALDNKAIDAAWRECLSSQPLGTSILASGLNVKQHFEHLAETILWPFGKNQAVYPPSTSNTQHIDWFDKKLSRHRGTLEGEEVVVQPDIVSEEEGSETFVVPDDYDYETDSDLDWNFDGGINPNTPRDVHSPMSGPTSTTPDSKRGNDSGQGGSGSKKTKLPGTGRQAADDPDTGNPSLENAVIPRPIHKSTGYTMVFRKNHSIISYGLASVQLQFGTFASERLGTTSLMYLPVDKPYFYMSPSEFKNIVSHIRGVKVLQVSCKVVMRNPRTAFETNASTSNLATLNQNKFVQYAHGLINKTRGFNTVYEFSTATNPMTPTSCSVIDEKFMKKVISAMYGTAPDNWLKPNWTVGATLPCSFMNLPMQFPSYYSMYANSAQNNGLIGWQDIQKFITKMDASAAVGSTIVEYTYKPTLSYLTMPWASVFAGRTNTKGTNVESFNVADTNSISLPNAFTLNRLDGTYKADTTNNYALLTDEKWKEIFNDEFNRYIEPLECGQYIKHGLRPSVSAKIQPSLHVGVCPVPQLTTTNANFVPDKFTDIECMWDIETELVCEYGLPYTYTSFPTCHIELEGTPMVVNNTTKESMFYEELSLFNNQFISPST